MKIYKDKEQAYLITPSFRHLPPSRINTIKLTLGLFEEFLRLQIPGFCY